MPVCKDEAKANKLKALVIKCLGKSDLTVDEKDIEMPFNPENGETYGTAFVTMANEE